MRTARELLEQYGPERMEVSQLLAVLLGHGTRSMPLERLVEQVVQNLPDLHAVPGLGRTQRLRLLAALELGRRWSEEEHRLLLNLPEAVAACCHDLREAKVEHVVVLVCNQRSRLLQRYTVSQGTLTQGLVHPREVFRQALASGGAQVILVHNHPSGDPEPSPADYEVTGQLVQAAGVLGVPLVDHVVVARHGWVSLRARAPNLFREGGPW